MPVPRSTVALEVQAMTAEESRLKGFFRPRSRISTEVAGRLGWGVADQAVSSLSNFAIGVILARSLGSEAFGAFSLAFVTYGFVLSAARGLATDPLVVRFSGAAHDAWRGAVAASTATAATIGVIAGLVLMLTGVALPPNLGQGFFALGLVLPGLLLQDSWRFAFFAQGRPSKALLNDLVWAGLLLATLFWLQAADRNSASASILAFGGTAALAGLFGLIQSGVRPRPKGVKSWILDHWSLGGRYLVENTCIGGARQVRMVALGVLAGLAAVGETRAAEILMGPFLVVLMGASQVAVPEASLILRRNPRRLPRFCFGLGTILAGAAATWGIAIMALLPLGAGQWLLGEIWLSAQTLLLPVIFVMIIGGYEVAAAAGVRGLGAARRSLRAQLVSAGLYVVAGSLGAHTAGALGSAWGVVIATTAGTAVWWVQLRRALREHPSSLATTEQSDDM